MRDHEAVHKQMTCSFSSRAILKRSTAFLIVALFVTAAVLVLDDYPLRRPSTPSFPFVSSSQLQNHSQEDDCWLSIYEGVYDLSAYGPQHPGGATFIYSFCGTNATLAFSEFHEMDVLKTARNFQVAILRSPTESPTKSPSTTRTPSAIPTSIQTRKQTSIIPSAVPSEIMSVVESISPTLKIDSLMPTATVSSYPSLMPSERSPMPTEFPAATSPSLASSTLSPISMPMPASPDLTEPTAISTTPTGTPTKPPTRIPTTMAPTRIPTKSPTTDLPTEFPTAANPTAYPTAQPSNPRRICRQRFYNLQDIARHDSIDSCWYTLYDIVWDLSTFLTKHPAGFSIMLPWCGQPFDTALKAAYESEKRHTLELLQTHVPHLQIGRMGEQSGRLRVDCETGVLL